MKLKVYKITFLICTLVMFVQHNFFIFILQSFKGKLKGMFFKCEEKKSFKAEEEIYMYVSIANIYV